MQIHIKLFAILRDRAGISETTLDLPPNSTITTAADHLAKLHVLGDLSRIAYAVNRTYAPPTTILHDGDELALIPPVSGG